MSNVTGSNGLTIQPVAPAARPLAFISSPGFGGSQAADVGNFDGLSVIVGGEIYMNPLTNIIESLQPAPGAIRDIGGGGRIIHVRDEYFPIVTLADVMPPRGGLASRRNEGIRVLLEAGDGRVALLVDELEGQHQVVIKSMETNFRHVPGISGATVMGNGRVALILDVAAFVRHAGACVVA